MDFYKSLGYLILGSRLRRLSDYFLQEVNQVYEAEGIPFEASWFPLFYILDHKGVASIREIANQTQVSHSAVSQLVSNLKKRGLVETNPGEEDARHQLVRLTPAGHELLERVQPIWTSLTETLENLAESHPATSQLLCSINTLEEAFQQNGLSNRVQHDLHKFSK